LTALSALKPYATTALVATRGSSILPDPTPVRALEDWLDALIRPPSPHPR
jgi:hypothetical protein